MKINYSEIVSFLKEKGRMCLYYGDDCENCPIGVDNNGAEELCRDFEYKYPEKTIEIVQKWSDEHPQKTYKDDFLEKFPDAPRNDCGYPIAGACRIYGEKPGCPFKCGNGCKLCWDKIMEE